VKLSPHFTLKEFIKSDTAERLGIDNTPNQDIVDNLKILAKGLEDVRQLLDKPIYISSGYRSLELNNLLKSKPTSQHCQGLAADFRADGYGTPDDIVYSIVNSSINYDQLIMEFVKPDVPYSGWVHISFCKNSNDARKQALMIDSNGVTIYKKQ